MTNEPGLYGDIKIIAGTSCPDLAQEIATYLADRTGKDIHLLDCDIRKFTNDNIYVRLGESVRGQDVYIIQTLARPVNDNIMELLIALDAIRRDSAGRITAVIPYMAYSRSDKKDLPRTPITARLVADMLQVAGAERYMTVDLHAGQIQGFFSIPGDVLTATHDLFDYVAKTVPLDNLTVVTTDLGFAKGGRNWARELGVPLAFIEKVRKVAAAEAEARAHADDPAYQAHEILRTKAEALTLIGDVKGRNVLLVDDEIDTGGSMRDAVNLLLKEGAEDITIAFTHAVFSGDAWDKLRDIQPHVREFIFTNTLPVKQEELFSNMTVRSVAGLLGEVIYRAHTGISVGQMFNE